MEQIENAADEGEIGKILLPADSVFEGLPSVTASPEQEFAIRNGQRVTLSVPADGRYRVYAPDGSFIALADASRYGIKILKSFFEVRP